MTQILLRLFCEPLRCFFETSLPEFAKLVIELRIDSPLPGGHGARTTPEPVKSAS